jgi:p21-activated kinase 1
MQQATSETSARTSVLRKKPPQTTQPSTANSPSSPNNNHSTTTAHVRRQSEQVIDALHATTAASAYSPVLPTARSGSDSIAYSSTVAGPPYSDSHSAQPSTQSRYSLSDQSPVTDLLGQRFDSLSVINSFDKISYGSQNQLDAQPSSQSQSQPHSPALASAFEEQHPHRPALQQSSSTFSGSKSARERAASRLDKALVAAGRRMEDLNARGGDSGARSPRQRYSDEARETNKLKKKSGFSSFMNNLVGTPRKPTISAPENPVHVTHVGYDQNTGEFTVRPSPCCFVKRVKLLHASICVPIYMRYGNVLVLFTNVP